MRLAVNFPHGCVGFLQCFNDWQTIYIGFAKFIQPVQNDLPFLQCLP